MTQLHMLYSSWLDQDLAGWIEVLLLPQSLVWLLGFEGNHSLVFVQYCRHHIETRQIYKYFIVLLYPLPKTTFSNLFTGLNHSCLTKL